MVLSKRERVFVAGMLLALGLAVVYQLVISPLAGRKDELDTQLTAARQRLADDKLLIATAHKLTPQWELRLKTSLKRDPSETESQVLNNVREWAQDARLSLSSVKPERTEKDKDFTKITIRATGNGPMSEIGRFLYRIQTATIPVRISDLAITTRKEATDDLALNVAITTTFLNPTAAAPQKVQP